MSFRLFALVLSLVSIHGLRIPNKPMMSRRSAALGLCTAFAPLTPKASVADSTVVDRVGMTLADPPPTDLIYANSIASTVVLEKNRQRRRQRAVELAVALCSFCALTLSGLVDQPATAPRDELDSARRPISDDEYSRSDRVWLE